MKLDQLLKREDFKEIFTSTLSKYLMLSENWEGKITWGIHRKNSLKLIVNKNINLIFPSISNSRDIKFLAKEYSYHSNLLRKLAQSFYIYCSLSKYFRKTLASDYISIEPSPEALVNICILPGNHSIRIVNLTSKVCIVISKIGFKASKLERAISIRNSFPNLPGPNY